MGSGQLSARGDLLNSAELFFALRHLCKSLPLHTGGCSRRLHTWLLRHGRVFQYLYSCVRYRVVLSALCWKLLVWSSLYLRSRCSIYVEFGVGLEHHDRCRLHQLLPILLSVVGTLGVLRPLLLGAGLGGRIWWLRRHEPI